MPNAGAITAALLEKVRGDAPLAALMPDGAWHKVAPMGATRFVIVAAIPPLTHVPMFGGVAYVEGLFLVEARALSTSDGDVYAAADRLAACLEGGDLTMATLAVMTMHCEEELEDVEVDEVDPSIRWNRCGGLYRVQAAPVIIT